MAGREAAGHQVGLHLETPLAPASVALDLRAVSDQRQTRQVAAVVAGHRSGLPLREPLEEMVARALLGSTASRMEVAVADAPIRPARPEASVARAVGAMAAIKTRRERLRPMDRRGLAVAVAAIGRAELHPAQEGPGLS